ncbi:hypothetical protein F1188_15965 [Roseospira marina]|uniref:Uncharacterized protein n=1 Tax=Roseospira marina TaxID=140057 RepID=A0A5M6I7Z7_9PROT|nr:hypothetical protein [Roseospira marina]KAA5604356.1 hypothetical protein F1188_15965 [Roseospira marina]MBB4315458.1 hypothetical protein [Roseospira marina]MBB5088396.1 hypothetical protein [Roseospira marina]
MILQTGLLGTLNIRLREAPFGLFETLRTQDARVAAFNIERIMEGFRRERHFRVEPVDVVLFKDFTFKVSGFVTHMNGGYQTRWVIDVVSEINPTLNVVMSKLKQSLDALDPGIVVFIDDNLDGLCAEAVNAYRRQALAEIEALRGTLHGIERVLNAPVPVMSESNMGDAA